MATSRGFTRAPNLGVALLAGHLFHFGLDKVPPATLALILAQSSIFLEVFPAFFPSAGNVCISSYLVLHHRDYRRIILGALYHGSDMHLYYNMLSLLYKGSWLEKRFGTTYFVYLISVFTVLTGIMYVGLGQVLSVALQDDNLIMTCAVGFSGVLFALKVLTTHYSPSGLQYMLGFIPIPSKYVYWVELLLIQLIVPNASFLGHLAGIIVGILYIYGPLKFIMDIFKLPKGFVSSRPRQSSSTRRSYRDSANFNFSRSQPSAPPSSDLYDDSTDMSYNAHRYSRDYTGGLNEDEQYARAIQESMRETRQSSRAHGLYPDLDELRSRRAQFYQ